MLNNTATEAKYNVTIPIDGTVGIKGDISGLPCFAETTLKFEVMNVGPLNKVEIHYKLRNSPNWRVLTTITGAVTGTVDISGADFIRYSILVADGSGALYASGFMLSSQVSSNIAVSSIDSKTPGSLLANVLFDDIQITYPTQTTELYKYYLLGVLNATVQLTYSDASKADLTRAQRV